MRIIKVSAINSTNSFAKELFKEGRDNESFCVVAEKQLQGRGQRGSSWESNTGENLTFSVVMPHLYIESEKQFNISAAVAVAIFNALEEKGIKKLKIKWPNDIMAVNFKIGGILVENFILNGRINTSVIGIGLNVNQTSFPNLPQASSLALVSGKKFELEELLENILQHLEQVFLKLKKNGEKEIFEAYHQHLFRIKKPSTFQLPDESYFVGFIEGIAASGKLRVQLEDDQITEFEIKEVKLCF